MSACLHLRVFMAAQAPHVTAHFFTAVFLCSFFSCLHLVVHSLPPSFAMSNDPPKSAPFSAHTLDKLDLNRGTVSLFLNHWSNSFAFATLKKGITQLTHFDVDFTPSRLLVPPTVPQDMLPFRDLLHPSTVSQISQFLNSRQRPQLQSQEDQLQSHNPHPFQSPASRPSLLIPSHRNQHQQRRQILNGSTRKRNENLVVTIDIAP